MSIDFEEDNKPLSTESIPMQKVLEKCERITELERLIEKQNSVLAVYNEELRRISEVDLPLAMDEANVRKLTLTDGGQLDVKAFTKCSLPKDNEDQGFDWLRKTGNGDLIKRNVSVVFGRGEDELAAKIAQELQEKGLPVIDKATVHYQTLNAFAKEQMQSGKSLPADIFSIYQGRIATIKRPKIKSSE